MILTAKADLQQGGGGLWDVRQGRSSFPTRATAASEQDLIYPAPSPDLPPDKPPDLQSAAFLRLPPDLPPDLQSAAFLRFPRPSIFLRFSAPQPVWQCPLDRASLDSGSS